MISHFSSYKPYYLDAEHFSVSSIRNHPRRGKRTSSQRRLQKHHQQLSSRWIVPGSHPFFWQLQLRLLREYAQTHWKWRVQLRIRNQVWRKCVETSRRKWLHQGQNIWLNDLHPHSVPPWTRKGTLYHEKHEGLDSNLSEAVILRQFICFNSGKDHSDLPAKLLTAE